MRKFQCFLFVLRDHIFAIVQFAWLYLKNKHYVNKINFGWGIEFRRGFFVGFSEHFVGFLSISRKLASAKIIRNLIPLAIQKLESRKSSLYLAM